MLEFIEETQYCVYVHVYSFRCKCESQKGVFVLNNCTVLSVIIILFTTHMTQEDGSSSSVIYYFTDRIH